MLAKQKKIYGMSVAGKLVFTREAAANRYKLIVKAAHRAGYTLECAAVCDAVEQELRMIGFTRRETANLEQQALAEELERIGFTEGKTNEINT